MAFEPQRCILTRPGLPATVSPAGCQYDGAALRCHYLRQWRSQYTDYDLRGDIVLQEDHDVRRGVTRLRRVTHRDFLPTTGFGQLGLMTREVVRTGGAPASAALSCLTWGADWVSCTEWGYEERLTCDGPVANAPIRGHVTSLRRFNRATEVLETLAAFGSYGEALCERQPGGAITTFTYDQTGTFLLTQISTSGLITKSVYAGVAGAPIIDGLFGQLLARSFPSGFGETFRYDWLGRLVEERDSRNGITTIAYHDDGIPAAQRSVTTLKNGLTITEWKDGYARTHRTERSAGALVFAVISQFDAAGNLVRESLPLRYRGLRATLDAYSSTTVTRGQFVVFCLLDSSGRGVITPTAWSK